MVKKPLANEGDIRDVGLIPGSGRSPGGGNSNLLLGRKVMTNLDSIFKSRDIANKGSSSQGYGFSCGHVWM